MKPAALQQFRRKLARDEPVCGLWVTLESPSITEMAVALGLDWVVIDAEHGHLDWKELLEHVRATVRSQTVALIRLAERNTGLIKRALDLGADGVVIPWMETAEQLDATIRDCLYPPEGRRGIGGERSTVWGQCLAEHTSEANEHVLIVPLIETAAAATAMPDMCRRDEVDVFFFGPADYSASAGYRGQWEGPGVAAEILRLKDMARAAGKQCGVMATGHDDLVRRREHGFRMLGLANDAGLLLQGLHGGLQVLGRDRRPATSFDPREGQAIRATLSCPPGSMRPDRRERVTQAGAGDGVELQRGVMFDPHVGLFNTARSLTTGLVTFAPAAELDMHVHPCSESVTVLEGELQMEVEGRVYRLGPLDNMVIPRWWPHAARNPDDERPSRAHVALAMESPERDLVLRRWSTQVMAGNSTGSPGAERVTRFHTARRTFGVGPGAEFIDYFNAELAPGLEMSGGFGRFQPGGRLPAHVHDFDESISIISGIATCLVEGRRYEMRACATAMVPRGRVHYFVNESDSPMDMIWVYAGPMPERIVVDESCVAPGGSPWGDDS